MEIPVTVGNDGDDSTVVELELRVGNYVFDTRRLAVPSGESRTTTFVGGISNELAELSLLRNGQKVAAIEVR